MEWPESGSLASICLVIRARNMLSCVTSEPQTHAGDCDIWSARTSDLVVFRFVVADGLFVYGLSDRPQLGRRSSRHTPQLAALYAMKLIALAIFVAAILIAAAILLGNRHTLELAREGASAWRLDQLTGELRYCGINSQSRERGCVEVPRDKIEQY